MSARDKVRLTSPLAAAPLEAAAAAGAREEMSPKPARGGNTGLCTKIDDTGLCGKIDNLFGEFVVEDLAQGGDTISFRDDMCADPDGDAMYAFAAKSKGGDTISYRDAIRADPDGDAVYAAATSL